MKKIVLLFVTSPICPRCDMYKKDKINGLKALKNQIDNKYIEFIEFNFRNITKISASRVIIYPSFVIIPSDDFYNKESLDLADYKIKSIIWNNEIILWINNFTNLSSDERTYIIKILCLSKYKAKNLNNKCINYYFPKYIWFNHILEILIPNFIYIQN